VYRRSHKFPVNPIWVGIAITMGVVVPFTLKLMFHVIEIIPGTKYLEFNTGYVFLSQSIKDVHADRKM
jgi:hypothetical protein